VDCLQCHDVRTKFHENRLSGSKNIEKGIHTYTKSGNKVSLGWARSGLSVQVGFNSAQIEEALLRSDKGKPPVWV